MDSTEAAPYQKQLLDMQAALLAQLSEQRGGLVSRVEVAAEHFGKPEDSQAQVNTERDTEFAIGEHETASLAAIDAALARIAQGSYGQCTDCGVDIPAARLRAAPQALRCISCQEQFEKHHAA